MASQDSTAREPGPWPRRLALGAALSAVPLVLFGGSVTTIGAGMAVDGWLVAEGHFLLFFPVEEWFRDTATFVEHTHRLFGVLVGLFALGAAIATFRCERVAPARVFALAALAAVCVQGTVGGLRVLENDSELAFLHGALAQAVFALLCLNALFLSRSGRAAPAELESRAPALRRLALPTAVLVYAQIVLGAWYRHHLRPSAEPDAPALFLAHALLALVVSVLVLALARGVRRYFPRSARRLAVLLGLQLALGLVAWIAHRPDTIGPLEWTFSVAHVLGGGLLFAQCAAICMHVLRAKGGRTVDAPAGAAALGGYAR